MSDPGNFSIKHWAEDDRPREKLLLKGRQSLSDAELLAILLGSGTKKQSAVELSKLVLRDAAQHNLEQLSKLTVKELMKFKGIGQVKAITIVAAMELARRKKESALPEKPVIQTSRNAYEILYPFLCDLGHEEFYIILINRANRVLKVERVGVGGITGTVADIRIMFQLALQYLATGIILAHNHPSGQFQPSDADIQLTRNVKEAGKILNIELMDHLIIAGNGYFSFTDQGII